MNKQRFEIKTLVRDGMILATGLFIATLGLASNEISWVLAGV